VHLGGAVDPAAMWGIAHAQGIRLPTKDYWEFVDLITVHPKRRKSFEDFLALYHWTELIQSSPIALEQSVYAVIGGAYRKANITTLELRFNPLKRNRGGEQDLDHIIMAAVRGLDRASLEYPVKAGFIFCLRKGDRLPQARCPGDRYRGPEESRFPLPGLRPALQAGPQGRTRAHRPCRRG